MSLPSLLRRARAAAQLNQHQLAELAGTSQAHVSRLEKSGQRIPMKWAERFAPHLDVSAEALAMDAPARGRWRHLERGTVYAEIGRASVQASAPIKEGDTVMVYAGDDGSLWIRPVEEFLDGRFEKIGNGDARIPPSIENLQLVQMAATLPKRRVSTPEEIEARREERRLRMAR